MRGLYDRAFRERIEEVMLPVLSVRSSDEGGDDKERLFSCSEAAYEPGWCHSFQQDSALGIDERVGAMFEELARELVSLFAQMRSGFRGSVLTVRV